MNMSKAGQESPLPVLTLFVTGDAPRSRRARNNLHSALERMGKASIRPLEIDLLRHPEKTESYSVFATPALIRMDEDGHKSVIYGDLSNDEKLLDFLEGIGE